MKKTLLLFVLVSLCHFLYAQPGPQVHFDLSKRQSCNAPVTINFKDLTSAHGKPKLVSWKWYFGDGTVDSTSGPKVAHQYTRNGIFSVRLVVRDKHGHIGIDSLSGDNLVRIGAAAQLPATVTLPANGVVTLRNLAAPLSFDSLGTYRWYRGNTLLGTGRTLSVSDTGRVTLRYAACGRTITAQTLVLGRPQVNWSLQTSYRYPHACADTAWLIARTNAPAGSYTITWVPGGNGDSVLVNQPNRSYLAILKDLSGTKRRTDSLWLPAAEPFTARLEKYSSVYDDTLVAFPQSFNQQYLYQWLKNDTMVTSGTNSILHHPADGLYRVRITDFSTGCSSLSDTVRIGNVVVTPVDTAWTINISVVPQSACGDVFTLSANVTSLDSAYSVLWSTGEPASSITVNTPGVYTAVLKDALGLIRAVDTVNVTFTKPFRATLELHPGVAPVNDTLIAYPNTQWWTGYGYRWYRDNVLIITTNSPQLYDPQPGIYKVYVQNDAGCNDVSDTLHYKVDTTGLQVDYTYNISACDPRTIGFAGIVNIAPGDSVVSYLWDFDNYSGGTTQYTHQHFDQPGTYDVSFTVITASGRSAVATKQFVIPYVAPWTAKITAQPNACGDTVFLTLNSSPQAAYYYWSSGQISQTIAVTESGYYIAGAEDSCFAIRVMDTIHVTINKPFTAEIATYGQDTLYALPLNDTLPAGYTYTWYRNDTVYSNNSHLYTPAPGVYRVRVTSVSGCSSLSSPYYYKVVPDTWEIKIETYGQVTCVDSIWLFANVKVPADKNYFIVWQNGQWGDAFIARTSSYYTARLFDFEGNLRATETIYIMITPQVNASLEIHRAPVPGNDTLVVYPQTQWWTGYFYRWYRDGVEVLAGNAPHLYNPLPGNYVVYVRSEGGCEDWSDVIRYEYADSSALLPVTSATTHDFNGTAGEVKMKTFPNPSAGQVHIQFDKPLQKAVLIKVYNLQGGVVYTRTTTQQQQLLDLSHLPKGYYVIELTGSGVKKTQSLLLQ